MFPNTQIEATVFLTHGNGGVGGEGGISLRYVVKRQTFVNISSKGIVATEYVSVTHLCL